MPTGNSLILERVSFSYPGQSILVLNSLDLIASSGAVIWCVGDNGSGKSTLGKLLCGLFAPTRGRILVDGLDPAHQKVSQRPKLAYVIQQRAYLSFTRATFGHELHFLARRAGLVNVVRILSELQLLSLENANPLDLSYTEAWRAALAIGHILDPVVLFVDELPNLVGQRTVEALQYVLVDRQRRGRITMIAAHELPPENTTRTHTVRFG